MRIDANNLVSGFGIMDLISIIGPHGLMQSQITVDMSALLPNVEQWLMGTDGQRKPIENARIEFTPKSPIYFGFASELPSTMLKKNEINNETVLLIGIKDFADISSRLRPYDSFEGTPEYARKFFLSAAVIPERVDSVGSIKMFARSNL